MSLHNQFRMKKMAAVVLTALLPAAAAAQGAVADYQRAFTINAKYANKVTNQAQDVRWRDSVTLSYQVVRPEGLRFVAVNAADGTQTDYATEAELQQALGTDTRQPRRGGAAQQRPFGRQKQRHWMEVDEERDAYPVASPDKKFEAYIEGENVVVHETGKPWSEKRILTQDGTLGCYYSNRLQWSPDGRYLFAYKRRPVQKRYVYYVESSPADQLQPILHQQEYAKPGDELPQRYPVIIHVETGRRVVAPTDLISNQYDLSWFQWTEDSREVTMEYNERGHKVYRVLAMSAETGQLRTIVEERFETFVNYSRSFRQFINGGRQLIWMSERDGWNHLYLFDVNAEQGGKGGKGSKSGRDSRLSGGGRQITNGDWCIREVLKVDEEAGVIYFSASGMDKHCDPYYVKYYRIGLDGKHLVCLTPADANHQARFSGDYRYLADTYSTVSTAPVTELRSAADGRLLKTLETADLSQLTAAGWRAPEVFVAKARDGVTDIWGLIHRPSNFDPQKTYPVIEYIYSGPGDAYVPKSFRPVHWPCGDLAELGFIVVQMDGMGTGWRGKQFEDVCYKNLKDAGFPDRRLWIKAAAEKYAYMDTTRVGIFGCSAGGQESMAAVLFHGDFYKAAYSACGCHDNRMDKIWWNEQWMGWPIDSSYVASSNVENAWRLQRPLMLVVGELDDNVDPASTMQVANALIKANKDFELVVIPGAHHTMGEAYGDHKRYDFFVRHLMGVNPPEWQALNAK